MARGRKKKEVDLEQVEKLAAIGCTSKEIGSIVGCSVSTLERNCDDAIKRGRANLSQSLKRTQVNLALGRSFDKDGNEVEGGKPNVTMLIWLGKQYLGQAEKVENKNENETKISAKGLTLEQLEKVCDLQDGPSD